MILVLEYTIRVVFILFFPLLIADFLVTDRLLRLEYFAARQEWNDDGKPHGYFWIPAEAKTSGGWFARPGSSRALRKVAFIWIFKTPAWVSQLEVARRLLCFTDCS
jgi:hypothetical protein